MTEYCSSDNQKISCRASGQRQPSPRLAALAPFKLHLGSPGSGMPSVEVSEGLALAWSHSEQ